MKVVCIKIPPFVDRLWFPIELEVGEIFDAYKSPNDKGYWCVKDRLGNVIPCDFEGEGRIFPPPPARNFITLEEWREGQLNKIL